MVVAKQVYYYLKKIHIHLACVYIFLKRKGLKDLHILVVARLNYSPSSTGVVLHMEEAPEANAEKKAPLSREQLLKYIKVRRALFLFSVVANSIERAVVLENTKPSMTTDRCGAPGEHKID